jgi:hypothetical protein
VAAEALWLGWTGSNLTGDSESSSARSDFVSEVLKSRLVACDRLTERGGVEGEGTIVL